MLLSLLSSCLGVEYLFAIVHIVHFHIITALAEAHLMAPAPPMPVTRKALIVFQMGFSGIFIFL